MLPFELTKDTPYLALSGELWSVFYEYFNKNWPCYKGFLLYMNTVDNQLQHYLWGKDSSFFSISCLIQMHALRWLHNEHYGISNHHPNDFLLNCLFRRRSKKTSMLHVTGLCERNLPVTGEFSAHMASYAENVSIWWRHYVYFHIALPCWLGISSEK